MIKNNVTEETKKQYQTIDHEEIERYPLEFQEQICSSFFRNADRKDMLILMICRWTPLKSHNQTEIDHVRLVFFQIRVENLKRGPPGFQFFVRFDVIRSDDQSQCRILSQRGPPDPA